MADDADDDDDGGAGASAAMADDADDADDGGAGASAAMDTDALAGEKDAAELAPVLMREYCQLSSSASVKGRSRKPPSKFRGDSM